MSWKGVTNSLKKAGKQAWKVGTYSPLTEWLRNDPSIPNTDDAATRERKRIDASVNKMNALYGIAPKGYDENGFSAANPTQFNANARVGNLSKKAIDTNIQQQGDAAIGVGHQDLTDRMDNWLTGSRHQLSDQGLIGGSVDAQERSRAITGYLQGKSSLNEARQTAEQNARNAIERRRASSEDLIRTGGSPILDAAFQQQVADVKEANQQIPYNALGDLFRNEAQVYSTTQQENRRKEGQSNLTNSMNQGSGGKYS